MYGTSSSVGAEKEKGRPRQAGDRAKLCGHMLLRRVSPPLFIYQELYNGTLESGISCHHRLLLILYLAIDGRVEPAA